MPTTTTKTRLYPFQREGVRLMKLVKDRAPKRRFGVVVADEQGLGKAQPMTARILTPTGWTRMGRIKIGDDVVTPSGGTTKVIGVYPQGVKKVYRLAFKDGASTEACGDHLWWIQTYNDRNRPGKNPFRVMTTDQIRTHGWVNSDGQRRYFLPLVKPLEFAPADLPIHPYLLGYLLANGGLSNQSVNVTVPDLETVERLQSFLPPSLEISKKNYGNIDYRIVITNRRVGVDRNSLRAELEKFGLMGKLSIQKTIPKAYRFASVEDRVFLLRGLMDGDGSVSNNFVEFSSSSKKLAEQVRHLIWSLGGTASLKSRPEPKYTYRGEVRTGQPHWRLGIAMPNDINPFLLSRKAGDWKPREKYRASRSLMDIQYVGKKECQCIAVASDEKLYVTDDYIVTHNTIQALKFDELHNDNPGPVVIVCPAHLKYHWRREAKKHTGRPVTILDGLTPKRGGLRVAHDRLYVINYDIVAPRRNKAGGSYDGWVEWLCELKPSLVIVDESHTLSNHTSKRSKAVCRLGRAATGVICLTGTPIDNKPKGLFTCLNLVRPDKFPSRFGYLYKFCDPRRTFWGMQFEGATNMDLLHRLLTEDDGTGPVMIRRLKKDVLDDLPPVVKTVIPVDLSDPGEYASAERDVVKWLRRKGKAAKSADVRTRLGHLKRIAANLKIRAVRAFIDDWLETGRKLIVFGLHKEMFLTPLFAHYKGRGVLVNGETPKKDRQAHFDRFNADPACKLFFGNMVAAGTGWSCTSASAVLFPEFDWKPSTHDQAASRVSGIGRGVEGENTEEYWMVGRNCIDTKLLAILDRKRRVSAEAIDGDAAGVDFDVVAELAKALLRGAK